MTKSKFLIAHQYPTPKVVVNFHATGRTKQQFAAECDINNIMLKFEKNQLVEHVNEHKGDYGDFATFESYHDSVNRVIEAQDAFMTVPAKIRAEFANDPASFLAFVQNPDNLDKMVEMGLAHQRSSEAAETQPLPKAPANPTVPDPEPQPAPTVPTTPV